MEPPPLFITCTKCGGELLNGQEKCDQCGTVPAPVVTAAKRTPSSAPPSRPRRVADEDEEEEEERVGVRSAATIARLQNLFPGLGSGEVEHLVDVFSVYDDDADGHLGDDDCRELAMSVTGVDLDQRTFGAMLDHVRDEPGEPVSVMVFVRLVQAVRDAAPTNAEQTQQLMAVFNKLGAKDGKIARDRIMQVLANDPDPLHPDVLDRLIPPGPDVDCSDFIRLSLQRASSASNTQFDSHE